MFKHIYFILAVSFSLFTSCQALLVNPDPNYSYHVPEKIADGWEISSLDKEGIDVKTIETLTYKINTDQYKNVHSLIIIKNNKLVYENYFSGYKRNTLHNLYSASKSVNSALVGLAVDKGYLKSEDEKVLPFFPEYLPLKNFDARKEEITLRHLLIMTSGLDCNDLDPKSPGNEEKAYKKKDVVDYTLNLPVTSNPGENASYCSCGVITLSNIITKAVGKPSTEFAEENLFSPLGITAYQWGFREKRKDRPDQIFMRPRDMAKFGQLFLDGGRWKNKQILSEAWVEKSLKNQVILNKTEYGYLWWRYNFTMNQTNLPVYAAQGNGGQFIFINPTLNLVVVITAGNLNSPLIQQGFNLFYETVTGIVK